MIKPPKYIEEMQVLYYTTTKEYQMHLKKYMSLIPSLFVIVKDVDGSYCILGTDETFDNWESYTNYIFKELTPAMEFPHVIFRLPPVNWTKV